MSKILVVLLGFAGLVPAGIWYATEVSNADWGTLDEQTVELEHKFENVGRFRAEVDRIIAEIVDENLPLTQAIAQVEEAARNYHPIYKAKLYLAGKGKSYRVQIAHNILQHVDYAGFGSGTDLGATRARLRQELREVCQANGEAPRIR